MRLLVFCGTKEAMQRYAADPKWQCLPPETTMAERYAAIERFKSAEGACLVVNRALVTGWRAPADTQVLFDPSWPWGPGSPEWTQATTRPIT